LPHWHRHTAPVVTMPFLPTLLSFLRHLTWRNLHRTLQASGQQRLMGLAAEMAFNSILALVPTIVLLLSAIALTEAPSLVLQQWTNSLGQIIPMAAATLLQDLIIAQRHHLSSLGGGFLPLSLLVALWAASSTLQTAMGALDQIQQIAPQQRRSFWVSRLIAIALTLTHVILFLSASFLLFFSDLVIRVIARYSGILATPLLNFWSLVSGPLALILVAIAFSLIYRFGPSQQRSGIPILPGALIAAFSWAQLSLLFRRYIELYGYYDQFYGILGSVIVLMLWLQLTALVMLLGQQLNVIVGQSMAGSPLVLSRPDSSLSLVMPAANPTRSSRSAKGSKSKRRQAKPDPFELDPSGPTPGTKRGQKTRQNRKSKQHPLQQPWHHGEESESPYDPDA
jgi:membrane protein